MTHAQADSASGPLHQAGRLRALMRRRRSHDELRHVANFAKGFLIGSVIVLFVALMIG
jgi:hypothetical protein